MSLESLAQIPIKVKEKKTKVDDIPLRQVEGTPTKKQ